MYIRVNANVSDESGANVYVTAFESGIDADAWRSNIETGAWDLASLSVQLSPFVPVGGSVTTVSGNVTHAYSNLNSFDPVPINVETEYFVYMYAVDTRNNSVAVGAESSVTIDVQTTTVVSFDDFMQYVDNPPAIGSFSQVRSGPLKPNVDYQGDLFRFYDQATFPDWDTRFYGTVHVDPIESVITGNVYTLVSEQDEPDLNKVAAFFNSHLEDTLVYEHNQNTLYNATIQQNDLSVSQFYPNVDTGTSNVDMAFGKEYHVYSMVKDIGFNTDVVKKNRVLYSGTAPDVSTVEVTVLAS